jgi:predicted SnoaL-like aldol condensation-catalyzing enzyme
MSKLESAMRIVIAFNGAFNRHDLVAMMQLIDDDCKVEHFEPAPDGAVYQGKEAVSRFWRDQFDQKPGAGVEIEDVFGHGDRCIMCWRLRWKSADGRARHVRGLDLFRVRDGLILEILSYAKA